MRASRRCRKRYTPFDSRVFFLKVLLAALVCSFLTVVLGATAAGASGDSIAAAVVVFTLPVFAYYSLLGIAITFQSEKFLRMGDERVVAICLLVSSSVPVGLYLRSELFGCSNIPRFTFCLELPFVAYLFFSLCSFLFLIYCTRFCLE